MAFFEPDFSIEAQKIVLAAHFLYFSVAKNSLMPRYSVNRILPAVAILIAMSACTGGDSGPCGGINTYSFRMIDSSIRNIVKLRQGDTWRFLRQDSLGIDTVSFSLIDNGYVFIETEDDMSWNGCEEYFETRYFILKAADRSDSLDLRISVYDADNHRLSWDRLRIGYKRYYGYVNASKAVEYPSEEIKSRTGHSAGDTFLVSFSANHGLTEFSMPKLNITWRRIL